MRRLLAGLLLALSACTFGGDRAAPPADAGPEVGPPGACDRTFVVSPDFPPEERAMLERSMFRWNAIATEQFCIRVGPTDGVAHGIFRIPYRGAYWQKLSQDFGGADVLGVHFGGTDQIGIVDALDADSFPQVALHELGHAHGLGHTGEPAIMNAGIGSAVDFTPLDLEECRRVGACPGGDAGSARAVFGVQL